MQDLGRMRKAYGTINGESFAFCQKAKIHSLPTKYSRYIKQLIVFILLRTEIRVCCPLELIHATPISFLTDFPKRKISIVVF